MVFWRCLEVRVASEPPPLCWPAACLPPSAPLLHLSCVTAARLVCGCQEGGVQSNRKYKIALFTSTVCDAMLPGLDQLVPLRQKSFNPALTNACRSHCDKLNRTQLLVIYYYVICIFHAQLKLIESWKLCVLVLLLISVLLVSQKHPKKTCVFVLMNVLPHSSWKKTGICWPIICKPVLAHWLMLFSFQQPFATLASSPLLRLDLIGTNVVAIET